MFTRIKSAAVVLFAAVMLSGCSTYGGTIDSLLSPPKLSEEQTEIYDALVSSVGSNIRLQYPKSGSNRSAFVIADIDDEPGNEAIVFYENISDSGSSDGSLRVNILDKVNERWESVYDHAGIGTGIERIFFSKLGKDKKNCFIIGYDMLSNEKTFKIYTCSNGILKSEYSDVYSSVFISDMDRDGNDELVVIHPNSFSSGKTAYIGLVSESDGSFSEYSSVALNQKATDFINIASGYVGTDTPAIFIDGISNGQISTEIIYSMNGMLRNPLNLSETELIKDTVRPTGYFCTDIDLDGIIEIPTLSFFPGYTENSPEPLYITSWSILDNYSIAKKYSSYYDISDGFCFMIPSRWDGVVTAKKDSANGDIVFYRYYADLLNSTEELMRLSVVSSENTGAKYSDGYTLLKSKDNINYLVKVPDNPDEPLILTQTEIQNNFYLMS